MMLQGIATLFWLAFVTNRAILINAVHPVPLADLYVAHSKRALLCCRTFLTRTLGWFRCC